LSILKMTFGNDWIPQRAEKRRCLQTLFIENAKWFDCLRSFVALVITIQRNSLWNAVTVMNEVKVKSSLCLTKHHAMKAYWGSGGIAPLILHLGTRGRWVVSFTPLPLHPRRKNLRYPLHRRVGGPQSRSGRGDEEENSQPLLGIEPRSSSP
jgi:hypothetical protein